MWKFEPDEIQRIDEGKKARAPGELMKPDYIEQAREALRDR